MLKESILASVHELRSSDQVQVTHLETEFSSEEEPAIAYLEELFRRSFHYRLPSDVAEILTFPPECAVAWSYRSRGKVVEGGEFRLINLFDAFQSHRLKLNPDDIPPTLHGSPREAIYFDFQPEIGNSIYALLIPQQNEEFPRVHLHDRGRILPMMVDVRRYIELLAVTKGFYYWQYLFCEIDLQAYEFGFQRASIRKMVKILSSLFPQSDLSALQKRMAEIGV